MYCGCLSVSTSAPEQLKQRASAEPDATLMRSVTYQYYERLPFCQPPDGRLVHKPATLGELVDGSRLVLTPYDIAFKQSRERAVLCSKALTRAEVKRFQAVRGRCGFYGCWLLALLVALAEAAGARRRSGTTFTSKCSLMSCPCGALWASWRKLKRPAPMRRSCTGARTHAGSRCFSWVFGSRQVKQPSQVLSLCSCSFMLQGCIVWLARRLAQSM